MGATQAALNQAAANIANTLIQDVKNGAVDTPEQMVRNLAAAVLALCEYNDNNGTATVSLHPQWGSTSLTNQTISAKPR